MWCPFPQLLRGFVFHVCLVTLMSIQIIISSTLKYSRSTVKCMHETGARRINNTKCIEMSTFMVASCILLRVQFELQVQRKFKDIKLNLTFHLPSDIFLFSAGIHYRKSKSLFFLGNPIFCFSRGHVNVIAQTHMKCNKFESLDPPLCPEMIIDVVEIVYLMRSEDVLVVSWQPHTLRKFWRYSIEGKNVGHFQSIDAHDPFQ